MIFICPAFEQYFGDARMAIYDCPDESGVAILHGLGFRFGVRFMVMCVCVCVCVCWGMWGGSGVAVLHGLGLVTCD